MRANHKTLYIIQCQHHEIWRDVRTSSTKNPVTMLFEYTAHRQSHHFKEITQTTVTYDARSDRYTSWLRSVYQPDTMAMDGPGSPLNQTTDQVLKMLCGSQSYVWKEE